MRPLYLLFSLVFYCVFAEAQTKTITGTIKDQTGTALSGASINGKGTRIGTTTDPAGNFRIVVPEKTKAVVVSYVGMVDKEVDLAGQTNIEVTLSVALSNLNEIVVIGYG